MYYASIDGWSFLRCPNPWEAKTAGPSLLGPGLLSMKHLSKLLHKRHKSKNPLLKGVPNTSARLTSPLVVTMGTSGV